ncbi:rhodanese-like domain-containing protein [Arthrobacter sp. MMS24-S77]
MSETSTTEDSQLVDAERAAGLIQEGALLIDVRSDGGRASTGSIPGAVIVDREQVDEGFAPESRERHPEAASTDRQIVVFCGSVKGSQPVAEKLRILGYPNVVHVDGGFLALKAAGVPTLEPAAEEANTEAASPAGR